MEPRLLPPVSPLPSEGEPQAGEVRAAAAGEVAASAAGGVSASVAGEVPASAAGEVAASAGDGALPRRKTRRERLREELLNAPNLLTLGRIALIPVYLWLLAYENRHNSFLAAAVFSVAAISDWVDGWLARVSNKITTLGKFLDPLADKLIVLSALVMLLRLGRVPVWVVVIILARELLISGLRTIAMSEGLVISASQGGKWKTSLQLSGIIGLMVHYHFAIDYFFGRLMTDFQAVGLMLLYFSLVPGIASAVDYIRAFYTLDTGDSRG